MGPERRVEQSGQPDAHNASPEPVSARRASRSHGRGVLLSRFGLLGVLVLFTAFFSVLRPDSFFTSSTFRGLLAAQSVLVLLALAATVPLVAGEFDLSIASTMGLSALLVIGLPAQEGVAWPLAIVFVLLIGVIIGLVHGLLVVRLGMNSFIVTLGSGVILNGVTIGTRVAP